MHRWVRGITVGVGGAALVVAAFGAGLSPAGAQDDPESDADAAVWNDQYATVDITNDGEASSGDNVASSFNGNVVLIGQGADADTELLSSPATRSSPGSRPRASPTGWASVARSTPGSSVIPGSPVVLPVLGGSATNLITSINNTAAGIAEHHRGAAGVSNSTSATLVQTFSGGGGATPRPAPPVAAPTATPTPASNNSQGANVGVSNDGHASSGGNRATTANGNAVVIGQGASADAGASVNGNSNGGGGGGTVTGGTASNEVGSVTNTAQGQASISTGDGDREQQHQRQRHPVELRRWCHGELDGRRRRSAVVPWLRSQPAIPGAGRPPGPGALHRGRSRGRTHAHAIGGGWVDRGSRDRRALCDAGPGGRRDRRGGGPTGDDRDDELHLPTPRRRRTTRRPIAGRRIPPPPADPPPAGGDTTDPPTSDDPGTPSSPPASPPTAPAGGRLGHHGYHGHPGALHRTPTSAPTVVSSQDATVDAASGAVADSGHNTAANGAVQVIVVDQEAARPGDGSTPTPTTPTADNSAGRRATRASGSRSS